MLTFVRGLHPFVVGVATLLVVNSCSVARAETYVFTTLAGDGLTPGTDDGVGRAARFNYPAGLALDGAGNLYIADKSNHTIRKMTADGTVTTLAGLGGARGRLDGVGSAARFQYPAGIAVDSDGGLLVTDGDPAMIRKISPDHRVVTLVGDIAGLTEPFSILGGLVRDGHGSLFVSDSARNIIFKVSSNGMLTNLSDTQGGSRPLSIPMGVAIDASGNLFVADAANSVIRKLSSDGVMTTLAGGVFISGFADGAANVARFYHPTAVAVDALGQVFVADSGNYAIRKITPDGTVSTVAGFPGHGGIVDGTGVDARFINPFGITVAADGSVFVADGNAIRKGVPSGAPARASQPGRLSNLSIYASLAEGEPMTLGTVIGGAGTNGSKALVARAAGPSLASFDIADPLADPRLALISAVTNTIVASNDNWNGDPLLRQAFNQVGAFAFVSPGSKDAAVYHPSLPAGNYSVVVDGAGNGSGRVIAELYDATSSGAYTPTTPRLINLSVLKRTGTEGSFVTVGFTVGGDRPLKVLLRAIGPGLRRFGVPDVMSDPSLWIRDQSPFPSNNNWSGNIEVSDVFTRVGAFTLGNQPSADDVAILTLEPGSYTANVSSTDGRAGMVLVEVYEVP